MPVARTMATLAVSLLCLSLVDGAVVRPSSPAVGLLLRAGSSRMREPDEFERGAKDKIERGASGAKDKIESGASGAKDKFESAAKESQVAKTKADLESLSEPPTSAEGAAEKVADIAGAPTMPPSAKPEELPMLYLRSYFAALTNTQGLLGALGFVLMSVLLVSMVACLYQRYQEDPPPLFRPMTQERSPALFNNNTWRFGLFDCMAADKMMCAMACCCPAIRWADTMRLAGFYGFWSAVLLCAFLSSAAQATAGITGLLFAAVATQRRQDLRKLFHITHGGLTFGTDCLTYLCCSCCAIIQEARVVEEAYAVQHPAVAQIGFPLRERK